MHAGCRAESAGFPLETWQLKLNLVVLGLQTHAKCRPLRLIDGQSSRLLQKTCEVEFVGRGLHPQHDVYSGRNAAEVAGYGQKPGHLVANRRYGGRSCNSHAVCLLVLSYDRTPSVSMPIFPLCGSVKSFRTEYSNGAGGTASTRLDAEGVLQRRFALRVVQTSALECCQALYSLCVSDYICAICCTGDLICFLHIVLTQRPFGSGMFNTSEPSSPLSSQEHGEAMEIEHARGWIRDRFSSAAEEAGVGHFLRHFLIY